MTKLKTVLSVLIVSILVTFTFYSFENLVDLAINLFWYDFLNIKSNMWLVVPTCILLAFAFFGAQHYLDPSSEKRLPQGLGNIDSNPTVIKLLKVLSLGFLSLVAGASLGPEAVLVPACVLIAGIIAKKISSDDDKKLILSVAIIALFAAFLHSFIVGLLSILIASKLTKTKLSVKLIMFGIVASAVSVLILNVIEPRGGYFEFPDPKSQFQIFDLVIGSALIFIGYGITFLIKYSFVFFEKLSQKIELKQWWFKALIASTGLSALYVIGGPLIMFTGNKSIQPMLDQAEIIGVVGILSIAIFKLLAISWSKAMGYRGGFIFPTILVASCFVAITYQITPEINFGFGLVATLIGVFIAEQKAKVLL